MDHTEPGKLPEDPGIASRIPANEGTITLTLNYVSYRQWLIGMALQGILAGDTNNDIKAPMVADWAIECADAVLEAEGKK